MLKCFLGIQFEMPFDKKSKSVIADDGIPIHGDGNSL